MQYSKKGFILVYVMAEIALMCIICVTLYHLGTYALASLYGAPQRLSCAADYTAGIALLQRDIRAAPSTISSWDTTSSELSWRIAQGMVRWYARKGSLWRVIDVAGKSLQPIRMGDGIESFTTALHTSLDATRVEYITCTIVHNNEQRHVFTTALRNGVWT